MARTIRARCDLHAYSWQEKDGKPQISGERLNLHYEATFRDFERRMLDTLPKYAPDAYIPALSSKAIQAAMSGRGTRLYLRSQWPKRDSDDDVKVLVRFDVDGALDVPAKRKLCDDLVGQGRIWWDASSSGYLWLRFPQKTLSKKRTNDLISRLHAAIAGAAVRAGFCKKNGYPLIEVRGGFHRSAQERDEHGMALAPRKAGCLDGKYCARLPKVTAATTMDDAIRFAEGIDISPSEIEAVIARCPAHDAGPSISRDLREDDDQEETRPRDPRPHTGVIVGEKLQNWAAAARIIAREMCKSADEIRERVEELIPIASRLYDEKFGGDGMLDEKRHAHLRQAFLFTAKTFDAAKIGKPKAVAKPNYWYEDQADTDNSLARAGQRLKRLNDREGGIEDANRYLRKIGQPELDLHILSIIDRTIAKNLKTNKRGRHEVPTKSLSRMANHERFGLKVKITGSTVAAGIAILTRWRIIHMRGAEYVGHARTYLYLRPEWYGYSTEGGGCTEGADVEGAEGTGARSTSKAPHTYAGRGEGADDIPPGDSFSPVSKYGENSLAPQEEDEVNMEVDGTWGEEVTDEDEILELLEAEKDLLV